MKAVRATDGRAVFARLATMAFVGRRLTRRSFWWVRQGTVRCNYSWPIRLKLTSCSGNIFQSEPPDEKRTTGPMLTNLRFVGILLHIIMLKNTHF